MIHFHYHWWLKSVVLLVTISILFWVQTTVGLSRDGVKDGLLLIEALQELNVENQKSLLTHSASLQQEQTLEEFHFVKDEIEDIFSLDMVNVSNPNQENTVKYIGKRGLSSHTKLQVNWVRVSDDVRSDTNPTTYLVITLSNFNLDKERYQNDYYFLEEKLEALSIEPKIHTSIQGEIREKISHDEQYRFIQILFQKLNGSVREGMNEDQVISLTGYSTQLNHTINSSGGPINLQIASRYDTLNQTTKITIGNPIIRMEY